MTNIYPAYTFRASPTYFAWVKLSIADLHGLREERGFEGQNLFFHLNHPIRYISLSAPVLAIDAIADKYTVLTLDDGSGATIEAKIVRLAKDQVLTNSVDCTSNTVVENVDIVEGLGRYDVVVDSAKVVDVGTVIKLKCMIGTFRGTKQLDIKRLKVLRTTDDEVKEWSEVARWKHDILSKPWILSPSQLIELSQQDAQDRRKRRDRERKRAETRRVLAEKETRRREKRRRRGEKEERRARRDALEMDKGALKGSDVLPAPWK